MKFIVIVQGVFMCLGVGGYIANIYKLVSDFTSISEMGIVEILRIIGIVIAPVGSVMGFI